MVYLCLKCKWKYVNMTKLYSVYLLSLLYCCPDFVLSKMLSRCDTYFICIFELLDHIKFCKVILNIFKVNMKFNVHSAHFNFYLKWKRSCLRKHHSPVLADSRGCRTCTSRYFRFHAVLMGKFAKIIGYTPHLCGWRSSLWEILDLQLVKLNAQLFTPNKMI